jgi:amino acid permease
MNLITAAIGSGVVALPSVAGTSGLLGGAALITICGLIAGTMCSALCDAMSLVEEQGGHAKQYSDVAAGAWGSAARPMAAAFVNVLLFGVACVFMWLLGNTISMMADSWIAEGALQWGSADAGEEDKYNGGILIAACCLLPTSFLQDMSSLGKLAPVGIVGALGTCIVLLIAHASRFSSHGFIPLEDIRLIPDSTEALIGSYMTILFSFGFHPVVPAMRAEMAKPGEMKTAGIRAVLVMTLTYLVVALPPVALYKEGGIPENYMEALKCDEGTDTCFGSVLSQIGTTLLLVNLMISYPLVLNVVITAIGTVVPIIMSRSPLALLLRAGLVGLTFVAAFSIRSLLVLVGLVSSVTMFFSMMWFNSGFYWALLFKVSGYASMLSAAGNGDKRHGALKAIYHVIVFLCGLLAFVVGFRKSVGELVALYSVVEPTTTITAAFISTNATTLNGTDIVM